MPWARDTLSVTRQKILADMAARLPGSDPSRRRSALNVFGTVFAGLMDAQLGYLDWQAREGIPFTSDGEYLQAWAGLRDVTLIPPAVAAGKAVFTGRAGATVFGAQQLRRGDGVLFTVPNGAVIGSDGTASVPVSALEAGSSGNTDVATVLTLVTPLAGIASTATVDAAGIVGGTDLETADELRSRMLEKYAAPPQGGDTQDYVTWALAVPGVTRAWCYGGAGTVVVYFMMDDVRSSRDGLPLGTNGVSTFESRGQQTAAGDQQVVADALYPLRAATALVYADAPYAIYQPLVLREVPDDATIQAAIVTAWKDFVRREASPGGVVLPDLSTGGVLRLAHLEAAIAAVPNLDHFIIVQPTDDIVLNLGEITLPGPVTFS